MTAPLGGDVTRALGERLVEEATDVKGHPVHYATPAVVVGAAFCLVMLAVVHPDTPGWVPVPALAVLAFVAILADEHRRHRH